MTTIQLEVPDRLARQAQAAGLLTSRALRALLEDAMQRQAAQTLLAGAARATQAGSRPLSSKQIQNEIKAVRRIRHSVRAA
jgi:post-segregation antitoxin (ccd killing protein)